MADQWSHCKIRFFTVRLDCLVADLITGYTVKLLNYYDDVVMAVGVQTKRKI
jgi:hypothetical protein